MQTSAAQSRAVQTLPAQSAAQSRAVQALPVHRQALISVCNHPGPRLQTNGPPIALWVNLAEVAVSMMKIKQTGRQNSCPRTEIHWRLWGQSIYSDLVLSVFSGLFERRKRCVSVTGPHPPTADGAPPGSEEKCGSFQRYPLALLQNAGLGSFPSALRNGHDRDTP